MSKTLALAIAVLFAISVWAQQTQEVQVAPVPLQIGSAKKVFISNAGDESFFHQPKDATYRTFIDPKTHVALWTIYKYVEPAGMTKNREKNYELAMTALLEDFKSTVAPAAAAASK